MKISADELKELKYLASGGTEISELLVRRMVRKWLITTKSVFSNSPYNGRFNELTPFGLFVANNL